MKNICTSNIGRSYIRKKLYTKKKARNKRYHAETSTNEYNADGIPLVNIPTRAESLLHNLKQAASDIGLIRKYRQNIIHVI